MPGVEFGSIYDLQEVQSMLAERVTEWTAQWKREGHREGKEEGREEGREEGLQEGLEKGRKEGEAIFLLMLLENRFGTLDETYRARVLQADSETLLRWGAKVLTATSLAEVFPS
jgi:flagellar biosynthesis/type III secretory pathway protein FliH